ncbi:hypothetical protein [Bacillus thuringiensis]|uniref:hypothetical protein n=1 Tax=Bacillus thuringiensis TaxID=1428 RepID=UPI0021D6657D|nr:hypothetical protein [Bacillus thuringiensis]MCU7667998.1 hypothetical protein [Bacillus thuringiensis]
MNLKLENKDWELCIDDSIFVEYDNYVSGFSLISDGNFQFDTIRVFISLNKETANKEISAFPWKDGETYQQDERLISKALKTELEHIVKETEFYKKLNS